MFFNLLFPLKIIVGETAVFCLQLATRDFENQEKTILTGDCCYINPLVRRTVRFLGMCHWIVFIVAKTYLFIYKLTFKMTSILTVCKLFGYIFFEMFRLNFKDKHCILLSQIVRFHISCHFHIILKKKKHYTCMFNIL